jgi:hypothetical protein
MPHIWRLHGAFCYSHSFCCVLLWGLDFALDFRISGGLDVDFSTVVQPFLFTQLCCHDMFWPCHLASAEPRERQPLLDVAYSVNFCIPSTAPGFACFRFQEICLSTLSQHCQQNPKVIAPGGDIHGAQHHQHLEALRAENHLATLCLQIAL